MEKEFLALVHCATHFRDLIMSCPIAFILSDSQPVLWALRHKDESVRLTRYLLKLFELPLNFICFHLEGSKNAIADYISRIAFVDENVVTSDIHPKTAQHVVPTFSPMQVITKDEIQKAFRENPNKITKCNDPDNCRGNVNAQLYRGLGRTLMSLHVCRKQQKSLITWLKQ
jgi:RNase H-like domain found in reverse transcriptase